MIVLVAKLALVPCLIAAITVAGTRFGPRVAGVLTGLPVVAGPVVLFLALEQGAAFATRSATATLAGIASVGVFCVIYARTAARAPWWIGVALGWLGFLASTLVLDRLAPSLLAATAVALATPLLVIGLAPRPVPAGATVQVTRGEIALRMAAGAALMLVLTAVASMLGPRLSGLLTVFPVATTILAAFSHRSQGADFAVLLLRGLAAGLYSLAAFFVTLALTLEPWGIAAAFVAAVAGACVVQLGLLRASL